MSRSKNTALLNHAFLSTYARVTFTTAMLLIVLLAQAQNVGVGLANPLRRLSVNGAILVDQGNTATGTLDSAALLFGSAGTVGILSKKTPGGNTNGLNFITGGNANLVISSAGNIGLGGPHSSTHRLRVNDGNSFFEGDITVDNDINSIGRMAVGGNIDTAYKLRVWGGNARIGGDFHATGNVAFGGSVDDNFRLRVHTGSSLFGGPVQITGPLSATSLGVSGTVSANNVNSDNMAAENLTVTQNLTIGGNGSVRSNGPSSLRIGFNQKTVDVFLLAGSATTVIADIADFSGGADNVRVFVSQLESNSGNTMSFAHLNVHVSDVDSSTDTCIISLKNTSNLNNTLKATIYLTTIAKN